MAGKCLEMYYDFSSTNAYFAAFLVPDLCRRVGASLVWKPFYLGHAFRLRDHSVNRDHPPGKLEYLFRDHQRWSRRTGLPFNRPTTFPIKTSLALRGSVVMRAQGLEEAYIQAVMSAYWARDEDIAQPRVLAQIVSQLGADGDKFQTQADEPGPRDEVARVTNEGIARNVFGAPMFFVGDEMFWGKDRLDFVEDLLRDTNDLDPP
jgi:2-hydroxychromene-2-carboxylate isomerase